MERQHLVGHGLGCEWHGAGIGSEWEQSLCRGRFQHSWRGYSPFIASAVLDPSTTQAPALSSPSANTVTGSPVSVAFSLPEAALPGSVTLTFTGVVTRVLTLAASQETSGSHSFSFNPANPTASAPIANGSAIPDGTYTVTLSYQDTLDHPAATAVATNFLVDYVTLAPTLTSPAASSSTTSPITVSFTLPEAAEPGSVWLTFYALNTRTMTLSSAMETAGAHTFNPANPTASPEIVSLSSGTSIGDGTGLVEIRYKDLIGNSAATQSRSNVTVDTTAPHWRHDDHDSRLSGECRCGPHGEFRLMDRWSHAAELRGSGGRCGGERPGGCCNAQLHWPNRGRVPHLERPHP